MLFSESGSSVRITRGSAHTPSKGVSPQDANRRASKEVVDDADDKGGANDVIIIDCAERGSLFFHRL